jgi:FKBP-type peptidyl-prolyl cis-trans isomerase
MMEIMRLIVVIAILLLALPSCQGQQGSGRPDDHRSIEEAREQTIANNRRMLQQEREWIEAFIAEKNWQDSMEPTGSGAFIYIIEKSGKEPLIESKMEVTFRCTAQLLDGTAIYEEADPVRRWQVDRTDGELGLHDILKKLAKGDKALAILPSYQAFGLAGDLDEVPPRAPILFSLEILDVQ